MNQTSQSSTVQLTSMLERIPLGVYVIDADFRLVYINPLAASVFESVAGGAVGKDFSDVMHAIREDQYAEETLQIFRRTLESGECFTRCETTSVRGRPTTAFYEWRVERVLMDDGRHGLTCFFRDLSGEALARQLDSFRVVLADALRPLDGPGAVQALAARLLGERLNTGGVMYAEVEVRPDSDYYIVRQQYRADGSQDFSGEYRANSFGMALFDELRAGRTLVVNDVLADARLSPEEKSAFARIDLRSFINVPLIKDGRHVAIISAHDGGARCWSPLDVALVEEMAERMWEAAERKKAEAKVRETEAECERQRRLYEVILSNTPDFAYIFDAQHRFIYANDGLLRTWGKTLEEAVGKTCNELGYEAWHAEMHNREVDQVIATRQPIRSEVPFTGVNGRRIYDYIFVPVFGPNGDVEAVAGTTRDVTESKEAERRKDEFLATLAHELRNPLAPIRNAVHVLSMSAHGDSHVARVCELVERQVSHMARLVDDLTEISRISRGIIELRRVLTSLETVVRSAVDTSTPLINAAQHTLSVSLPAEPVTLYCDPVRLAQVISNLLNNAAKYTDRGGRIWLSAEQQHEELIIQVRDNGVGIAAEARSAIFDMFMQVKDASSHTHGGLGIGLPLAKHLVELHGGTIAVASEGAGRGSEFLVRLPCIRTQASIKVPAVAVDELPDLKRRVLIVDDNIDAATSLALLIRRLGADVQVANDGAVALALMHSFKPEVALLDLGMPGMSGYEIATRARQLPGMDKLKLIALTGWGQPEDRERTRAAGFDHHLVKPTPLPELQRLLASLN